MRQAGDGDEKGDQQDGEAVVDSFHLSDNSGREEKYVTCIDPTRLTSENSHQPWQESGKNDGIEERNSGKDGNVESWGEGNIRDKGKGRSERGERVVGSRVDGEKMVGSENVRLKLALVECRLLLQDQVGMMITTVTKMMVTVIKMLIMVTKMKIAVTKMMIAVTKMLTTMTKMLVTMIIMKLLQESQLSRERAVADARLSTITAQLARFLFFVFIISLIRPSLPQSSVFYRSR